MADKASQQSTDSSAPLQARKVTGWQHDADVVVVGYGAGGASAAVAAARAGASVLIVEAAGGWGGATSMSGGEIYLGGGTPIQKQLGFDDTAEQMYRFLSAATGPAPDEAKLAEYCEHSVDHFHWLDGCGVEFNGGFYANPDWEAPTGYSLMYTGGENAYPFNEIAVPAPRGHIVDMADKKPGERSAGWMLAKNLAGTADGLGARALCDTRAKRLIVDGDRLLGVQAVMFGRTLNIRARKGVVLAAGGFGANNDMLVQHAPRLADNYLVGTDGDDGRGIRMAQALGAAVRHMDAGQAAFPVEPALMFRSLVLDRRARRFVNEDTYAGRVGQQALFTQGGHVFVMYDAEIDEQVRALGHEIEATLITDDLAEIEQAVGFSAGSLANTVAEYNVGAEIGEDPVCHKAAKWLKPLRAPYGIIDLRPIPSGIFTLGGLVTNTKGQVLNVDGDPIPRLFAAGRVTSGIPSWGYCSGTSLGDSTFFGRRAGASAAAAID